MHDGDWFSWAVSPVFDPSDGIINHGFRGLHGEKVNKRHLVPASLQDVFLLDDISRHAVPG
jgi:hypothetical protein